MIRAYVTEGLGTTIIIQPTPLNTKLFLLELDISTSFPFPQITKPLYIKDHKIYHRLHLNSFFNGKYRYTSHPKIILYGTN